MKPVRLVRRAAFAAGHRYWREGLSAEENRALFGEWASPYSHGHNFILWVTAEGEVDAETGMVVNIKRIDDALQERVVARFGQKSINDEVPEFADRAPSLENLLDHFRRDLADLPGDVNLTHLRLEETEDFWAEWSADSDAMTLTRSYEFAAAHRLHSPELSLERNLELYGKCHNEAGHGHNFVLEVTVAGEPHGESGMICDLGSLDKAIHERVVDRYDHANLNHDIPELQGKIPTSEVVVQAIWDQLDGRLPAELHKVRLLETPRSAFEVSR